MLIYVTCLLSLLSAASTYHQSDYVLILERAELVSYNKAHVNYAKIISFKYNRTHFAINYTLNFRTDFGNKLEAQVQGYKFASNEYRLFPATFTVNLCDTIRKNDFGIQNFYCCGNLTKCPMVKGNYSICNWYPDYPRFPPYLPHGRYMVESRWVYRSMEVIVMRAYATINSVQDFAPWK